MKNYSYEKNDSWNYQNGNNMISCYLEENDGAEMPFVGRVSMGCVLLTSTVAACATLEVSMPTGRLYAAETCVLVSTIASRLDSAWSINNNNKKIKLT